MSLSMISGNVPRSELFYDILHELIAQAIAIGIIKNIIHTAIDATHVWANSNRFGIKADRGTGKCQCLKKYSDPDARWGHKTRTYAFFGWKSPSHCGYPIPTPLEAIVTSGEVPDNTQAPDLIDGAIKHHSDISISSIACDAAYDDTDVYKHCIELT